MRTTDELRELVELLLQHDADFRLEIQTAPGEPELDETGRCAEETCTSRCKPPRSTQDTALAETQFGRVYETNPAFYHLLHEMARLHNAKQHDYCGEGYDPLANLRGSEMLGVPAWKGTLIRMSDKWERIRNFALQEVLEVKDESFVDTLLDLAVYALHVITLFREAADVDRAQ